MMTTAQHPKKYIKIISTVALIISSLGLLLHSIYTHATPRNTLKNKSKIVIPTNTNTATSSKQANARMLFITVKPKQTLGQILKQHKIDPNQINQLIYQSHLRKTLRSLKAGTTLTLKIDPNHSLSSISYQKNDHQVLTITHENNRYTSQIDDIAYVRSIAYKSATVQTSLALAAHHAGIPQNVLNQFEQIFRGTVNFKYQIRKGDRLRVIYNEYYQNGKPQYAGNIRLAQLTNHNKTYTAVNFHTNNGHSGYYNINGRGMQPLFLKNAIHYKRISSRFSLHRLDPFTHKVQPHYGVDYAAPTGTPIHSIGRGKIITRGWIHGYGRTIRIRYNSRDVGLYAHMSRYAHVHLGQWVNKKQVIGYVGMSGWATGPHLHFGWYINGKPTDPLKRKVVYNPPIARHYRQQFKQQAGELMAQLKLFEHTKS